MVGLFLLGGCDGWNVVAPLDGRYDGYARGRDTLALPKELFTPLDGTGFGLHPSLAPLKTAWNDGGLGVVLNTGPLFQPLTRDLYQRRPDLRPVHLMSHADGQAQWQGMRMREENLDGFLGRLADRTAVAAPVSPLISTAGSSLAVIGANIRPLVLPAAGPLERNGYEMVPNDAATRARQAAIAAMADASAYGPLTRLTAKSYALAYEQAQLVDGVISAPVSAVDAYFVDATGAELDSDIASQLNRIARMIESRSKLGHDRQTFFASQGGYDTHATQIAGKPGEGRHSRLLADLAQAMAAFYAAMKGVGLQDQVTLFTMSDFGRTYAANAAHGSDHAWGNNHLVLGGGLKPRTVHGRYPDTTLGGPEDSNVDGRWIPSIAVEEYVGAIAQWYGVAPADMPYVFPNWATWNGGGRGPAPLFA